MRDYFELGPTPYMEDCAQVGSENYRTRAKKETRAYINLLERVFPIPEELSGYNYYGVKWFSHEFGSYCEVVIYYDDLNDDSVSFALDVEDNAPEFWDKEALEELNEKPEFPYGEFDNGLQWKENI